MSVAYYDQRWKVENELTSPPSQARLNQIGKFIQSIPKSPRPQRLLDIGCGNGWVLQSIEKEHGSRFHYFGLEPSSTGTANARRRVPSATIFEQTLEEFTDNVPFDVIICSEVIEHVVDAPQFLALIHDLLNEDGIAILTTPNGCYRTRFFKDEFAAVEQPIENWLTTNQLRRMCQNKFQIQLLDTFHPQYFFKTHPVLKSFRLLVEKLPGGKRLRRILDRLVSQKLNRGLYIRAVLQRERSMR